jgi:hypothetical protein
MQGIPSHFSTDRVFQHHNPNGTDDKGIAKSTWLGRSITYTVKGESLKLNRNSILNYLERSDPTHKLHFSRWDRWFMDNEKIKSLLTRTLTHQIREYPVIVDPENPQQALNLADLIVRRTEGSRKLDDGTIERGCFEDDVLTHGIRTSLDGTIESGEFEDGALVGGMKQYPDGTIELGRFVDGLLDGPNWQGIPCQRKTPNGMVVVGSFQQGVLVESRAATQPTTLPQVYHDISRVHHALSGSAAELLTDEVLQPARGAVYKRSIHQVVEACTRIDVSISRGIAHLKKSLEALLPANTEETNTEASSTEQPTYKVEYAGFERHTVYVASEIVGDDAYISVYNTGGAADLHDLVGESNNHILPLRLKVPKDKLEEVMAQFRNWQKEQVGETRFTLGVLFLKWRYRLDEMAYRTAVGRDTTQPLEYCAYRAQVAGTCSHEALMALALDRCGREDFLKLREKELQLTAMRINRIASASFSPPSTTDEERVITELASRGNRRSLLSKPAGRALVDKTLRANNSIREILPLQIALLSLAASDVSAAQSPGIGPHRRLQVGFIYP